MIPQLPLPPAEMRWGGPRYRDDETYIKSGQKNARMLAELCEVNANSRILDIGCGQARLLHGLISHLGQVQRYVGLDVHKPSIDWLQGQIAPAAPFTAFHLLAVQNERYNKNGGRANAIWDVKLENQFDCITLFSVFSHMPLADVQEYFKYMHSVIADDGRVFLTAFVEDDVEDETENPDNYHREWKGALHCVRLNRQVFERIAREEGFQVQYFKYRHTNDGQSSYVFTPITDQKFRARLVES